MFPLQLQVTNLPTTHPQQSGSGKSKRDKRETTHISRLRKVLVRRKPLSGYQTLVNDNNKRKLNGSIHSQPKKHRVVIFKYISANRKKTNTAGTIISIESTALPLATTTPTPIIAFSTITQRPGQNKLPNKIYDNLRSIDQTETVKRILTLTTSSTELSTRTYTYVVERVHNDQHEILESISTFTRINTRIVPITLTIMPSL